MLRKFFRKLFRFFVYFIGVTLGLMLIVSAAVKFFQNDIRDYAVSKLDQYLATAVYVQGVELSIWEKFPNATLDFKDVLILDAYPDRIVSDTFFHSKHLYLQFNLKDLIDGQYSIEEIEAENSNLNIRLNKEGEGNFNIIKKTKDTVKSNFDFALEKVHFNGLRFNYYNHKLDQHYAANAQELNLIGNFSTDSFAIQSNASLNIHKIRNRAITFIKNKEASFDLSLNVNLIDSSYSFKNGIFNLESMPFKIDGFFNNNTIDFEAKGKQITLDRLMQSINKSISGAVYNYNSTGLLDFEFYVKGNPKDDQIPKVSAKFKIKNGSITEPQQNLTVKNINIDGEYSNEHGSENEFLELKKLKANTLDGSVNGTVKLVNFSKPVLTSNLTGFANLQTLHRFFHFKGIDQISGTVNLFSQMTIAINDPKYAPERFKIKKNKGNVQLTNVSVQPSGNSYFYEHIDGKIILQGTDAVAKNISLKIKDSDLKINGSIKNLVPFLENQGKLNIIASIESDRLNTENLILPPTPNSPSTSKLLPANINLNVDIDINQLLLGKHHFEQVHSKVKLLDQKLIISKLYVEHAGGKMTGNLTFNTNEPKHSTIDANIHLKNFEIKKLFKEWDNFDQKAITYENINGKTNLDASIFAVLNEKNELVKNKLIAKTKFKITDGGLKNVAMMKTISGAMRDNKMVKMFLNKHIDAFEEKLMNLKFDTLTNSIFIKNNVVTMPKMRVASNALDMNISATHDFNNNIDYHFDFLFNNLKSTPEITEFGRIENDGTGFRIFLHMFGHLENPEFGWDKEQKKISRKENMEAEKQTIKSMLKQEFGLYKGDSTLNGFKPTPKKEEEFLFYDGEFDQKDEPKFIEEKTKTKKKPNKVRTSKFFQRLEQEQKNEQNSNQGSFEIDQ